MFSRVSTFCSTLLPICRMLCRDFDIVAVGTKILSKSFYTLFDKNFILSNGLSKSLGTPQNFPSSLLCFGKKIEVNIQILLGKWPLVAINKELDIIWRMISIFASIISKKNRSPHTNFHDCDLKAQKYRSISIPTSMF